MPKVVYYWYDHLLLRASGEAEIVQRAILNHDYKTFMEYYKKYGKEYLPEYATIHYEDGKVSRLEILTEENFNKITHSEFECG